MRLDKEEYDVKEKIRADQVRIERFLTKIEPRYVNFFKTSEFSDQNGAVEKEENPVTPRIL